YNIYADQIEMRSLVDPSSIDIVTIGAQKFIHSSYVDINNVVMNGYFEMVVGGDVKLLLRREIDFKQATYDIEGYGASSSTSVKEEFYIKKDGNPAVKLEKSKEFFKELMNDKNEVVDYIDKQIILFFTEKKVREIIEYYNQI
ncbi:MAG TPA: hypothetical protein P5132_01680, partial [Bacteroidales bacterium]|nr:hypothetical protein [Bacteroidales bacterium]